MSRRTSLPPPTLTPQRSQSRRKSRVPKRAANPPAEWFAFPELAFISPLAANSRAFELPVLLSPADSLRILHAHAKAGALGKSRKKNKKRDGAGLRQIPNQWSIKTWAVKLLPSPRVRPTFSLTRRARGVCASPQLFGDASREYSLGGKWLLLRVGLMRYLWYVP